MRFLILLAAAALASACAATTPAASVAAAPSTASASQASSRAVAMLVAAGRVDAPTQAEVERILGQPDIARQDGAGAALTYRLDNCALLLLFEADARNQLRLAQAYPSARRAGQAAPSLEQCAAEAGARRS